MEAKRIDLNDFRLSGEGANGVSYDCLSDPQVMMKMYNPEYPLQPIFDELEVAQKVYRLGVPSPEPGELVTDGVRTGIMFRRIEGKRSFSRMFADEPDRTEEFAREMARHCKKLHSIECPEGMFPDAKQQFRKMLSEMDFFSTAEKEFIGNLLDGMPDGTTVLHGDMHFGNIVTNLPKGAPLDTPHDTYFIDLGYFSKGHPILDLGMMANICLYSTEEFVFHDMHITKAHAGRVLDCFIDEYFFSDDNIAGQWFGPGQTPESIKRQLYISYLVKSILVSYNLGFKLPEFQAELDKAMQR